MGPCAKVPDENMPASVATEKTSAWAGLQLKDRCSVAVKAADHAAAASYIPHLKGFVVAAAHNHAAGSIQLHLRDAGTVAFQVLTDSAAS
eukprot:CAMPEP_0117682752 /NCGR_PEP_ID=MMETSP0804-20121206/19894_1 /TAXON_ID=1074897 /ORGANISM="Tetraselmis astigmatica, Strain CCMP880" /LENGTH=89 /DNA_ID=CAMNT_0005493019 /DNA_START=646 /DNA_END=915 /DNA_ORIENTATION=-